LFVSFIVTLVENRLIDSPPEYHDHEGDLNLLRRAKALDDYLGDIYGELWNSAMSQLHVQLAEVKQTKNLWAFFLLAASATRSASANDSNSLPPPLSFGDPIRRLASFVHPNGSLSLAVVAGHSAIAEDLSMAWHPAWQGVRVEGAQVVTVQELSQIEAALQLIEATSVSATSLVGEVCAAICLLRTNGRMDLGSCVSLTSKFIPGLIYFTPAPVIMTAESIVHESAHLWLSRFELSGDLYVDADRKVASPLRPDSRPVSGLLHQIWVLSHLVPFYRDLSRLSLPLITANSDKLAKRLAQHATDLEAGLGVISDNEDAFTDRGRDFVKSLTHSNSKKWR
jgi:hypothetical protein